MKNIVLYLLLLLGAISAVIQPTRFSACGWIVAMAWYHLSNKWQKLATDNLELVKKRKEAR